MSVKLIIVGGFLGAGKTTSILALAKRLAGRSFKVGLVTNDQGSQLVDTEYLRQSGFPVLEVNGGCFCCNFDQFADRLAELQDAEYPDYILAEPVGSCTDLIATLLKPLRQAGRAPVALAPLSVVVDPKRLTRVMRDEQSPFPNEINYLFRKQLEEADLILLNKVDQLKPEQVEEMIHYLRSQFPAASVLPISATADEGLSSWEDRLMNHVNDPKRVSLEIAYDTYARAEEVLGWLNCTVRMSAAAPFDGNELIASLIKDIRRDLLDRGEEIAHLKIYVVSGNDFAKQSLVSLLEEPTTDHRMAAPSGEVTIVLNIRALSDPEVLEEVITNSLSTAACFYDAGMTVPVTEAFRPSYPRPVHRLK